MRQGMGYSVIRGVLLLCVLSWPALVLAQGSSDRAREFEQKLEVSAPEQAFVDVTVNFKINSDVIQSSSRVELDSLAMALNSPALQAYRFQVEGHTDMSGGYEANLDLSRRRAMAVSKYLASRGVSTSRLVSVGKAYQDLLPNLPMNDPQNRRVVVRRI